MSVSGRMAVLAIAIVLLASVADARQPTSEISSQPTTVSELRAHAVAAGHEDDRRGLLDALLDLHLQGRQDGALSSLPMAVTFELYVAVSGKTYQMGSSAWGERLQAFSTNMEIIAAHDKSASFTLGLNQYADWTAEEFESAFLGGLAQTVRSCRGLIHPLAGWDMTLLAHRCATLPSPHSAIYALVLPVSLSSPPPGGLLFSSLCLELECSILSPLLSLRPAGNKRWFYISSAAAYGPYSLPTSLQALPRYLHVLVHCLKPELFSQEKQASSGDEGSGWKPPAVPNPEEDPARYLPFEYEHTTPSQQRVDWRDVGAVGPVKNQHIEAPGAGPCSCCWAFAAVAALESAVAVQSNTVAPSLSEQQLMACDYHPEDPEANHGCQTGLWWLGWDYIINNGGVRTEAEWPYLARNSECDRPEHSPAAATMTSYEFIDYWNETALLGAVTHQPTAIEVCVGTDFLHFWQHYTGGVYDIEGCMDNLDHALLVVGYDLDGYDGQGTWVIKNSWGADWGEGGYMRVPLGMGPEPAPGKRMGIFNMYHRPGHPSLSHPETEAAITKAQAQFSRAELRSAVV